MIAHAHSSHWGYLLYSVAELYVVTPPPSQSYDSPFPYNELINVSGEKC
jgi:hypothetical protein